MLLLLLHRSWTKQYHMSQTCCYCWAIPSWKASTSQAEENISSANQTAAVMYSTKLQRSSELLCELLYPLNSVCSLVMVAFINVFSLQGKTSYAKEHATSSSWQISKICSVSTVYILLETCKQENTFKKARLKKTVFLHCTKWSFIA